MVWYKPNTWFSNSSEERVDESLKHFKSKDSSLSDKKMENQSGEGVEDLNIEGFGISGLSSFNMFYDRYINRTFKNEVDRIFNYRKMASNPEISDIVEDAVNESLQEDDDGYVMNLQIDDESINKKEQLVKKIHDEFYDLFYDKLNIEDNIWNLFYTYFVDGRVYFENVTNQSNTKQGLIGIKKLPSETMDRMYDRFGRVEAYLQYLKKNIKKPENMKEAEKDDNIIVFYPSQINFIPYQYGENKNSVYGYLEKCKVPYNSLKLLETSMVIYRIVRAPERFVFKIDTGAMPREKAMKFVEGVKQKMNKKQSFDPERGTLINNSDVLCIRKNTEIKLLDGRCLPLTQIIDEYKQGKENWVYTVNQDTHKIEPGKIVNAKLTRPNEKLVRVYLDDSNYIDTTYDHKFIMRDSSEKRADELKESDLLMDFIDNHKIAKIEYLEERDDTGCITVEGNHNFAVSSNDNSLIFLKNSILDNFWLPQGENRGSDVSSVGGSNIGFKELDDIHYFAKKLFRSLKYPISRIEQRFEDRSSENLFRGNAIGEITRDEIKWSKFLERQQKKFSNVFRDIFLLHLSFKGLQEKYGLSKDNIKVEFNSPSDYKEQMYQQLLDTRFNNYLQLSNEPEFSKKWLMIKYLKLTEEQIKENAEMKKEDKELGLVSEEDEGGMGF